MRLKGLKAAVVGGASGIGAGIGKAYANEGADVAFLDIAYESAELMAVDAQVTSAGKCFAGFIDVTDKRSVETAFDLAIQKLGGMDVFVYSAGVSVIVPFLQCDEDVWDKTLDINLKGLFLCAQSAIKPMIEKKSGSIICLSSQSGKTGASQYQAYCASKFGMIGVVQSLAIEFAGQGIRVNALCPGVVYTPMWDKQLSSYAKKRGLKDEEVMPYFISKIPVGRLGEVGDIADAAVFLAGKESSYITGQSINLCGGQVMF